MLLTGLLVPSKKRGILPPQSDGPVQPREVYWNRLELVVRRYAEEEKAMQAYDDVLIRVHADWNGWLHAEVRAGDLRDIRWLQPNRAPHAIVHADILCSHIVTGMLPHDCARTSVPHRLVVCILKKHVIPTVYAELARRADEPRTPPASAPDGSHLSASSHTIGYRSAP